MIEKYFNRIIPVIDIKDGKVVHAIRGEREKYRPLRTKLSKNADPVEFARNLPFNRVYVADLDSILYKKPNKKILMDIIDMKDIMLDLGIESFENYIKYKNIFNCDLIIASETLKNENDLELIVRENSDIIFSVDIKNWKVISNFLPDDIRECYEYLKENFRIRRFLFINLSAVGTLSFKSFDRFKFLEGENVEKYYGGGINESCIENAFKIFNFLLIGTLLYNNWRVD